MTEKFFYGGQAVLEGVMMRGRTHFAVAARRPDGEIEVHTEELRASVYRNPIYRLPFLRGVAGMWETMHLGYRALSWSAQVQTQEAAREDAMGDGPEEIGAREVSAAVIGAVLLATAFFVGLPLLLTALVYHGHRGSLAFTAIEGVIRVVLLLGYLALIAKLPDIRRVFQYHGAEHMTINCFEHDETIDVSHVAQQSLLHPRCGTGFLLVVALVSVIVFSATSAINPSGGWLFLVLSRVLLVPVIAAISYEFIRLAGRHRDNPVWKVVLTPVLATQRLTTRVPDAAQIEVAIAAFTAARAFDLPLAA
jgi:uncharacterized protein YqhQ